MANNYPIKSVMGIVFLFYSLNVTASHIKGGEIRIEKANGPVLNYTIFLTLYADTGSSVSFESGILKLEEGIAIETTEANGSPTISTIDASTEKYVFTYTHTFSSPGSYTLSYEVDGRNLGIVNVGVASNTSFYIESQIIIDPFLGINQQPLLTFDPIDNAVTGKTFFHNLGVYDPDGDSISYQVIFPKQAQNENIAEYSFPNDRLHYEGSNYDVANEVGDGPPGFSIDAITGLLIWDAPGTIGEYLITIKLEEWRRIEGKWLSIGFITRDMQLLVAESNNSRPDFTLPADTCVVPGTVLTTEVLIKDADGHPVTIKSSSETYSLNSNPASFTTNNTDPQVENTFSFNWNTSCEQARSSEYKVYVKVSDQPPSNQGPSLATFKTWNIAVAGAPAGLSTAVVAAGEVRLNWRDYACNATESLAIYRKANDQSASIDACAAGIPSGEGLELVGTVAAGINSFLDTNNGQGLDPTTIYCYRLVARYGANGEMESYPSNQECVQPNEASIVTNIREKGDKALIEDAFKIYPNPASTNVNISIDLPTFQSLAIRIVDANGRVYKHLQMLTQKQNYSIPTAGMHRGIYILQFKTKNQMISKKLAIH